MANWQVRFSSDYGATFGSAQTVSAVVASAYPGFDTARYSAPSVAAGSASVYRATTAGGAYSAIGAALTATYPILLLIPWYQWTSTTTRNTSSTAPHYLLGTPALVGGASLWRDDGAGSRTDISPDISGTKGLATGNNCATTWKGTYMAMIASFSGTKKLVTSTNSGGAWTDRGASGSASSYIRLLRKQLTPRVFYFVSGATLKVTRDWGATIASKTTPSTALIGVEPYG